MTINPKSSTQARNTFKQVDVGQRVTIDEAYMAQLGERYNGEANRRIFKTAQMQAQELIDQAKAQARQIIDAAQEEARQTAEQIVEQEGRQQCERICLEAYDIGYQKGLEDGQTQIHTDLTQQVRLAEDMTRCAYETQQLVYLKQKDHMLNIVQTVLQRILADELTAKPDHLIRVIEQAVKQLADSGHAKVRVHPDVYSHILALYPEAAQNEFFTLYPSLQCDVDVVHLETLTHTFNIHPQYQLQALLPAVDVYLDAQQPADETIALLLADPATLPASGEIS